MAGDKGAVLQPDMYVDRIGVPGSFYHRMLSDRIDHMNNCEER